MTNRILLYIVVVFLVACANQVSPTGGPKDNTPPQMVEAIPADKSVNFNTNTISIRFDEFFNIKDASKILVSPPLRHKPIIKVKKKELRFTIIDTLSENTTYSINFGESISDITENNKVSNFKYVFSTGSYLDSMEIKGNLSRALDGKTEEGWLVMLYNEDIDSLPLTTTPYYYTRTDENGNFHLSNLKPGSFKTFALIDQNFNYKYDLPNEEIAFSDSLVTSQIKAKQIQLLLFDEGEDKQQKLLRSWPGAPGIFRIAVENGSENLSLKFNNPALDFVDLYKKYNKTGDTLAFYLPNTNTDSVNFVLSDSGVTIDTAVVELKKIEPDTLAKRPLQILETILTSFNETSIAKYNTAYPIKTIDKTKIYYTQDSSKTKHSPKTSFTDSSKLGFGIKEDWQNGSKYNLVFQKGAITNIHNQLNDSLQFIINVRSNEFLGNVNLTFKDYIPGTRYIARLKNKKGNVSRETFLEYADSSLQWEYLEAGDYTLEVIEDTNGNNEWDPGSYGSRTQSEIIHRYPGKIQVRANWDMDLEIEL